MTLWSPDTCGCQIEISDDPATRGQVIRHVKKCPDHQNSDHHDVLAENKQKNAALSALVAALPGDIDLTDPALWTVVGKDAARKVVITLPDKVSKAQADAVLAAFPKVDSVAAKIKS
jgi:hypothetical protein